MNIPKRVARGVALLDLHRPGWAELVDLTDFEMTIATHCVIGQVFEAEETTGHSAYELGLEALMDNSSQDSDVFSVKHGFDLLVDPATRPMDRVSRLKALRSEWVSAIIDRRATHEFYEDEEITA